MNGFSRPDLALIGESDARAGQELEAMYRQLCGADVSIRRMSLENAEVTKIALNSFVTMRISFANVIAELCATLPTGDSTVVLDALACDRRVGSHVFQGATRFGGPCFPRDNRALAQVLESKDVEAALPRAADATNRGNASALERLVSSKTVGTGPVAILGVTYKTGTDFVEESAGLVLAESLAARGIHVIVSDPQGLDEARSVLGDGVDYVQRPEEAIREARVVVLATAWPSYRELDARVFQPSQGEGPKVVIDCWRLRDPSDLGASVEHIWLGVGPGSTAPASVLSSPAPEQHDEGHP